LKSSINSPIFLAIATAIVIFSIVITAVVQGTPQQPFSQVITVGPVWKSNSWSCTSEADFMVHGVLRALEDTATLAISISNLGTQATYYFDTGYMETFSVGSPANHIMTITRTGPITGWITLQTTSGAIASCTQG